MTDNVRGYPDISFVETDTETVTNALIRGFERIAGRTLYPGDPVRLFILWVADIIIQERVNIDFSAKQNLPRYAEGEYLDSLAEIFKDAYRLEPETARATFRFTLSIERDTATVIPAGTRLSAGEEILFSTVDALTIPAGELTGDVAAVCLTAGEIGNGFVPGQITKLVDIFPYFERVENITESAGGADRESDAAFYERMRESMETFSTAG
ncbi:MAG: baseplate J/gp47 family protein, partial [Lachnospiraceae bacterium]|nr:baseplate J/gp47 family protein [Lachnospiraceae bacterium]